MYDMFWQLAIFFFILLNHLWRQLFVKSWNERTTAFFFGKNILNKLLWFHLIGSISYFISHNISLVSSLTLQLLKPRLPNKILCESTELKFTIDFPQIEWVCGIKPQVTFGELWGNQHLKYLSAIVKVFSGFHHYCLATYSGDYISVNT